MNEQDKSEIKDIVREAVKEAFVPIDKRFDGVDGRLDKIEGRLDKIDGRLDKIDGRLDTIEATMVRREDFQSLFVEAFEPYATDIFQEFAKLNLRLESLEERIGKLERQGELVQRRLDNIELAITDRRTETYEIQTAVQILRERVAELEDRIAKLEGGQDE